MNREASACWAARGGRARLAILVAALSVPSGCLDEAPPPGRATAAVTTVDPARPWVLRQMAIAAPIGCATPPVVGVQTVAFDVDGDPDLGWSETNPCLAPAGLVPHWARVLGGSPELHTVDNGLGGGDSGLRGTPALFLGRDNNLRMLVDDLDPATGVTGTALIELAASPAGPGTAIEEIADPSSSCGSAAYLAIGEAAPEWVTLTGCGELRLDGAKLVEGPVAGVGFDRTDDGDDLVLFNEGGNVFLNSDAGPSVATIRRGSSDVTIAHGSALLYAALAGFESTGDDDPGLLGFIASADGGATWTQPVYLDTSRAATGVRLVVDRQGAPAVTYWVRGDLHLAQLVDKDWRDEIVASLPFSADVAGQRQIAFAFDTQNDPVILFYNWCASAVTLAQRAPAGTGPAIDLVVSTTVEPAVVAVGGEVDATITISNQGTGQAEGVVFTQTLPAGTNLLAADPPPDAQDGDVLTFALGHLESCCATKIVLRLSATALGVATGTGTASFDGVDADPSNDSAPLTIDVRGLTVTNPGDQTSAEGHFVSLAIVAFDSGGLPLTYSATGLPPGLAIDAATGVISGTPPFDAAGSYAVGVTVTNGQDGSAGASFHWTVTDSDRPPTLQRVPDQQNYAGETVSVQVVASDLDGDPLTYSARSLPAGLTIEVHTGLISGTLPFGQGSNHTVTVSVDDARGGTASTSFTWTIRGNDPPTIHDIPDQTSHEGDTIIPVPIVAHDSSLDFLTFRASGLPAGLSIQNRSIVGTVAYTTAGVHAVTVTVSDGHGGTASTSFTWTVIDTPALFVQDVTVNEPDGQAYFTVLLSDAVTRPVSVLARTADGTARAGSDYTRTSHVLTFAPGETFQIFAVPIIDDTLSEATETFTVSLANASGAPIGRGQATGHIVDDDPLPALSIAGDAEPEGSSGTRSFGFGVSLSAASGQVVTVDYATADGTATAGSDYRAHRGTVSFAPGETQKTIFVLVNGDVAPEPDETFTVELSNPVGATLATTQATGTILNDDVLTLSIGDVRALAPTAFGADFSFPVSLSSPCPDGMVVAVAYSTADGTAHAGVDYQAVPQNPPSILVFQPGERTKTIPIHVLATLLARPTRQFVVNLDHASGAVIGDGQGVGTILGDDPLPNLSIGDVAQREGNTGRRDFAFDVTLSAPSFYDVSVAYATADGTATAPADYTATNGTLTIAAGQTHGTIHVFVLGDTLPEPDETFFVDLSAPANATLARARGQGTILRDDSDVVTIHDAVGHEPTSGQANLSFSVTLAFPLNTPLRVFYSTSDVTAHSGADYIGVPAGARGHVDFAAGELEQTIDVPILADTLHEPTETFRVTLLAPNGAVLGGTGTAVGAILDPGAPWIDGFTPATGPVGTSVTLTGNTLGEVTSVTFAAPHGHTPSRIPADFTVESSTEIVAVVPAGAVTGSIVVVNADGAAATDQSFWFTP